MSHELLDTQVNPAVWEMSGHIVLKRRKDFVEASEEYACKLLSEVSLPDDQFLEVKEHIIEVNSLLSQEEPVRIQQERTSFLLHQKLFHIFLKIAFPCTESHKFSAWLAKW